MYDYTVSYGKRRVPVYWVWAMELVGVTPIPETAFAGRNNRVFALEVDVEGVGGDFLASYTEGDNTGLVATDSMKNFIIRQALDYEGAIIEGFLNGLGRGFLTTSPQIHALRVDGREMSFVAASVPNGDGTFSPSEVLFDQVDSDVTSATIELALDGDRIVIREHRCGRVGMRLMKTTGSAFTRLPFDGYTMLPERGDRA
jgi:urate oxidase